jgi:hypothetical protein
MDLQPLGSEIKELFFLHAFQIGTEDHTTSYLMITRGISPRVKRWGREAGQSPPTSAVVRNTQIYTATPKYVFRA